MYNLFGGQNPRVFGPNGPPADYNGNNSPKQQRINLRRGTLEQRLPDGSLMYDTKKKRAQYRTNTKNLRKTLPAFVEKKASQLARRTKRRTAATALAEKLAYKATPTYLADALRIQEARDHKASGGRPVWSTRKMNQSQRMVNRLDKKSNNKLYNHLIVDWKKNSKNVVEQKISNLRKAWGNKGNRKPSNGNSKKKKKRRKTSNGNRKPSNGNRKPSNGNRKTSNGNRKTSNGNRKPSKGNRKTSNGNRKSSNGNRKPSKGNRKPSSGLK